MMPRGISRHLRETSGRLKCLYWHRRFWWLDSTGKAGKEDKE
jgi:hypothetical protein